MQGSSLSDAAVIQTLNSKFIPLYADVDVYGFPEGLPGIEKYRSMWKFMEKHKWGIATSVVVDSTGRKMLGESGSGFFFEWKTSTNYYADKFLAYLQKSLGKCNAFKFRS